METQGIFKKFQMAGILAFVVSPVSPVTDYRELRHKDLVVEEFGIEKVIYVEQMIDKSMAKLKAPLRRKVARTILEESYKLSMDPVFLMAIIKNESQFNPVVKGRHGEIGLMQIKPSTAKWVSKKFDIAYAGAKTLLDPVMNIKLGSAYLGYMKNRYSSVKRLYLSAYNMGIRGLTQALRQEKKPTQYTERVEKYYRQLQKKLVQARAQIQAAL